MSLDVAASSGRSHCARVHEAGSLRVRFPHAGGQGLEAILVNTAGGIAEGDRFDIAADIGRDARLVVTTAAAEKIYRSLGATSALDMRFRVEEGGGLVWVPQETILFDAARLRRTIEVNAHAAAHIVIAEMLVFGRTAMGEAVIDGSLFDRWRIRRGGKLTFAETIRLDDDIAKRLGARAVAAGGVAAVTIFVMPATDEAVSLVRDLTPGLRSEVAASAWNGFAVIRLLAADAAALRADFASVLLALQVPLPRLWLN